MDEKNFMEAKLNFFEKYKPVRGIFEFDVIKNGEVIKHVRDDNHIVDGARFQMAHLIGGDESDRQITTIAFGTNGTAPTDSDTTITNAFEKDISGHTYPEAGQVQFAWNLATTEDNGQAIMEFGLLCADGTLFARFVLTDPIYKQQAFALQGTWTIEF
jgi:hypothetical protein